MPAFRLRVGVLAGGERSRAGLLERGWRPPGAAPRRRPCRAAPGRRRAGTLRRWPRRRRTAAATPAQRQTTARTPGRARPRSPRERLAPARRCLFGVDAGEQCLRARSVAASPGGSVARRVGLQELEVIHCRAPRRGRIGRTTALSGAHSRLASGASGSGREALAQAPAGAGDARAHGADGDSRARRRSPGSSDPPTRTAEARPGRLL